LTSKKFFQIFFEKRLSFLKNVRYIGWKEQERENQSTTSRATTNNPIGNMQAAASVS
jgi:hypothetical protein